MIVEIAVATHTAPRDWWEEDDRTIATTLDVLNKINEAERRAARGK